MVISLEEAKLYLRLDSNEDDALVTQLIEAAESLCMDIARIDHTELEAEAATTRIAVLYAVAYLYEHREEVNQIELLSTLKSLLFGARRVVF
jgi:uncharacterized phage protein (predicted DNA packaging)